MIDIPANEVPSLDQVAGFRDDYTGFQADLMGVATFGPDTVAGGDGFRAVDKEANNIARTGALIARLGRIITVHRHEAVLARFRHEESPAVNAVGIVGIDDRADRKGLIHKGVIVTIEIDPLIGRVDLFNRRQDDHNPDLAEVDIFDQTRVVSFVVGVQIKWHDGEIREGKDAGTIGGGHIFRRAIREIGPEFHRGARNRNSVGINHVAADEVAGGINDDTAGDKFGLNDLNALVADNRESRMFGQTYRLEINLVEPGRSSHGNGEVQIHEIPVTRINDGSIINTPKKDSVAVIEDRVNFDHEFVQSGVDPGH